MSWQAVEWVLASSRSENAARLVAIVLAHHANPNGDDTYPSIPTIAREARLGESTVRAAIEKLKTLDELQETGFGPRGVRRFRVVMVATEPPGRSIRARPHRHPTPAGSAPPQDLRGCAGSGTPPPQDLAPTTAGSAAKQPKNHPEERGSPVVVGRAPARASAPTRTTPISEQPEEELAEHIRGILQRGIDGLTSDAPTKTPTVDAIRRVLAKHEPTEDVAIAVAVEVRSIAQSQNRAPNIAGLYATKLAERCNGYHPRQDP